MSTSSTDAIEGALVAPPSGAEELDGPAMIKATNPSSSVESYGVLGISHGAHKNAAGVAGENTVTSGRTVGVLGRVHSNQGVAIKGVNTSTTAPGAEEWANGVHGESSSDSALRVPTISFTVAGRRSSEIPPLLDERKVAVRWGDFYAQRLVEALGLAEQDGIVRVSAVHYNTLEEVDRVVEALDAVL